jgi:hypothetical protein
MNVAGLWITERQTGDTFVISVLCTTLKWTQWVVSEDEAFKLLHMDVKTAVSTRRYCHVVCVTIDGVWIGE